MEALLAYRETGSVVPRSVRILALLAVVHACGSGPVWAIDHVTDDLSASVEVAETFRLSISDLNLAFHQVTPGEATILGEGRFFNEIHCRANSGRPWQLKAKLVQLKHVDKPYELEASRLSWSVVESTGAGDPTGGLSAFQPFSTELVVLYASRGDDQRGKPVVLKLQYRLLTSDLAPPGDYIGQVVFTLVESP